MLRSFVDRVMKFRTFFYMKFIMEMKPGLTEEERRQIKAFRNTSGKLFNKKYC